jgi:FtsP/CotA-like multicopper oxidase with cupredoxin domain
VYGEDPNGDPLVRKKIREIPLAIQSLSFYDNGALFYPANRLFFDGKGDGDVFAETSGYDVPFRPNADADISPVWNPEAFFDTWVVNGKTWPKLDVAPEQYRFRFLNLADSTTLNLALKLEKSGEELPFYVIGSDQGYLPFVVKLRTGFFTQITEPGGENREEPQDQPEQGLLLMPGERYDVIIDFTGLEDGTEILMINTAPNEPFSGFDDYIPADSNLTGQVLKFIVDQNLTNPDGDQSTPATCLRLNPKVILPEASSTRVLRLLEKESETCIQQVSCSEEMENESLGPSMALLGYGNDQYSYGNQWKHPIEMNPSINSTEIVVGLV